MTLDDNEFGVRIRNTEATPGLPDSTKQNFILERSLVQDSDIRGIDSQNLMGLSIQNSSFDNNGDDAAAGRETILLDYTTDWISTRSHNSIRRMIHSWSPSKIPTSLRRQLT
jgi:hypothetical protein